MFVSTGNGTHTTVPPFNANTEYGESIVTFDLANGGLTPTDEFTSYNYQDLNDSDLDQGAGGVLMIPDQSGANPHILVEAGKEGRILVLNRDNLGGFNSGGTSNTNALQDITGEIGGMWATPAYWNGNVYIWASKDFPNYFHSRTEYWPTSQRASPPSTQPSPAHPSRYLPMGHRTASPGLCAQTST